MDRGRKHVQISFDDLNRIRILDPEHFKQTEGLAEECQTFNESQDKHIGPTSSSTRKIYLDSMSKWRRVFWHVTILSIGS